MAQGNGIKKIFFWFGCLFVSGGLFAQPFAFQHLSVEQGLPNYSVLSLAQDKTGFLWMGTTAGLCRYDGTRMKIYRSSSIHSGQISNDNILSLCADSKGRLWVGSSAGIDIYDAQQDRFKQVLVNGRNFGSVFCIFEDSKKRIWVGTIAGVIRLGKDFSEPAVIFAAKENNRGIAGNIVKAMLEDKAGNMWIGTDRGLSKIESETNNRFHFTNYPLGFLDREVKKEDGVTTIASVGDGRLWIGTQGSGLYLFNPRSGAFVPYKSKGKTELVNNNVRCITEDSNKNLWIGTQEGISILNTETQSFTNLTHSESDDESLSQNSIYNILQDKNGSTWVATYFGGVNILPGYQTPFLTMQSSNEPNKLNNNVVSSIAEDAWGNLWIGTEGGGVNYYNYATGNFKIYKNKNSATNMGLGSNLVKAVYIDKEQNIWAGTHGGGLNLLSPNQSDFKRFIIDSVRKKESEITSIIEDDSSMLWIAATSGLKLFKKTATSIFPVSLPSYLPTGTPRYLYKDKRGCIWMARTVGLYCITGEIAKAMDTTITVNSFVEDNSGHLWMGTQNKGLLKFDYNNNQLSYINEPDLTAYNIVGLLAADAGYLWLSTDRGLIRLSPGLNNYQLYTKTDGLAGNGFNYNSYLKDSRGNMYFGGFSGITYFSPADIKINPYIPSVVFTSLKLENKEITVKDASNILKRTLVGTPPLSFAYNQNVITIEFALLNYIKSNKNKYAYRLEGFDNGWTETAMASATYTKLPPGQYRFMLKGANNDGLWTKPISLNITIRPPFWLSWWAYCLYTLLVAAFVFIIARFFFMRALLKREDELHQAKLNFFTNVSHEIRSHLTLAMAPVERISTENSENGFIKHQLSLVKKNMNRLLKLVGELMDFRKAETGHLSLHLRRRNLISFLQSVYESFRDNAIAKNITSSFMHEKDSIEIDFDEEQLEKVFFNLLANAVKFTPEGGQISLYAHEKGNNAVISITDNGRGIAAEYIDKLFTNFFQVADHGLQNTGYGIGLALAKNIVTLHNGTINVQSTPSENGKSGKTVFTVTLPKSTASIALAQPHDENPERLKSALAPAFKLPENSIINNTKVAGSESILIVEDNSEMTQLIKESLYEKYAVLTAGNGMEGWNYATKEIPDLIISDVMMPEMDGYMLCKKIKTDERTSHVPVILLTAKSSQSEQISGLEQGADIYLTKPFSVQVLLLTVQNLLAARERIRNKFTKELSRFNLHTTLENDGDKNLFSSQIDRAFLEKIIKEVDEHLEDPKFGVEMLSKKVAMSPPVLYKKLRALTNMSVNEFVKVRRFKKAAYLLLQKDITVNEVSYSVGYEDRKYFSREFKKYFGVLPSEYAGEPLNY